MSEPPIAGMSHSSVSEKPMEQMSLVAEDLARRRAVHARGDELLPDLRLAEPPGAPGRPVAEATGHGVDGRRWPDSASPPVVSAT